MDEASCHLADKVKAALVEAKILPVIIPGSTTSILQPLDVAINKPLKSHIRRYYEDWLEEKVLEVARGPINPPDLENLPFILSQLFAIFDF